MINQMNKSLLLSLFITLAACSSTKPIQLLDGNSAGISVLNVTDQQRSQAYRMAEHHCAKYAKVPTLIETANQLGDDNEGMSTMVFHCLRPAR